MLDRNALSRFPWGKVISVHTIGDIDVIEYYDRKRDGSTITKEINYDKRCYHPYLCGKDTNTSFETLDQAIVGAICEKYEGINSRAAFYIFKMIGMTK